MDLHVPYLGTVSLLSFEMIHSSHVLASRPIKVNGGKWEKFASPPEI